MYVFIYVYMLCIYTYIRKYMYIFFLVHFLFYFYLVNHKGTTAGVLSCHRGVYDDKRILNLVKILQCVVVA